DPAPDGGRPGPGRRGHRLRPQHHPAPAPGPDDPGPHGHPARRRHARARARAAPRITGMKTVRFGVIGAGLMGREFASAAGRWHHLLDQPGKPVITAVCDVNAAARAWFTESLDTVTLSTEKAEEVLASPDVDAVYIAVPHNLHADLYVKAIEAGKHLLGEKPFGIDLPACTRIVAAAHARPDLIVRCSSEFPFYPG